MNLTSLNLSQPLMGNPGTPGIPPNTTIASEWVDVSSLYSLIATISQSNTGGTLYIDQSNNKSTFTSTSVAYVSVEQLLLHIMVALVVNHDPALPISIPSAALFVQT